MRLRVVAERPDVDVHFFPVNLAQLSLDDPNATPGGEPWFEKVREIPTDLVLSNEEDQTLEDAVAFILCAQQRRGWRVEAEGEEVHSLQEAFVRSLPGMPARSETPDHCAHFATP